MNQRTLRERLDAALQKFTKWRAVFAGWQLGTMGIENEVCRAVRDHREVTMLLRAEGNALLALLVKKGVFTVEEWQEQLIEEAQHLDKAYEHKFPGFRSAPNGIVIHSPQIAADTMRNWKP